MIANRSSEVVARHFWAGTDLGDIFPRDIEKAVALKLPLALIKLPRVTVPGIRRWLQARRVRAAVPNDRRELMGCLVAYRGFGVAFICGADPQEEQRLTVAHETAHFLQDYLFPREELLRALGDEIAGVLDGKRPPTLIERANAVLAHVRLGAHVHLLPRNGQDEDEDVPVAIAEDRADGLGLELVAPREHILNVLRVSASISREESCRMLGDRFGLPAHVFHAVLGKPQGPKIVSFLEDVRAALGNCE